jgi:hypothetical protein
LVMSHLHIAFIRFFKAVFSTFSNRGNLKSRFKTFVTQRVH